MNTLDKITRIRRGFDPAKKEDIDEYRYFLRIRKWRSGCPFYLEWPYLTIPDMIKDKIIMHVLKV